MHSVSVRIPVDIPPALHSLIEMFYWDALRVRCVADETANAEIIYIARFCRHVGLPDSCEELFRAVSPELISGFLAEYAAVNSPGSLRWLQVSLRSFLHFAYRSSLIERDLSALVPVRSIRRLGTVPRSLPDECIARLRSDIDRSTAAGMRDSAIICLLAIYGVRGVQIRRLRLDDIDWRRDRVHFPAANALASLACLHPKHSFLPHHRYGGLRINAHGGKAPAERRHPLRLHPLSHRSALHHGTTDLRGHRAEPRRC